MIGSRILAEFGVLDGFGDVSARDPNNPNHFLMSRCRAAALVTADDIMEFDLDGNAIDPRGRSLFLERFIHSEIYKARPDVMSVVHTHSPGGDSVRREPGAAAGDVSQRGVPARPARRYGTSVKASWRDRHAGPRSRARKSLAQELGDKPVVLMRGHGDVTVGPSVKMAVFRAYYTDVDARLQSQAVALGGEVKLSDAGRGRQSGRDQCRRRSTASGTCGRCVSLPRLRSSRHRCSFAIAWLNWWIS